MRKIGQHPIELLAPARDAQIAVEAIKHGADAVYMGAPMFGARAAATNSIESMSSVCQFAHQFNARVYATVNTLIYDNELNKVERMIWQLWNIGVDALIVQDLGILRLDLPPISLHASTQCDLRTPEKARFLQDMGFSQLVMARELTLREIADIHRVVNVPLEAFVHGALCVCYSGRCQMSQVLKGRSANRGECAQMCRLPYDLIDDKGNILISQKHLLSLRDLNRSQQLEAMIDAGVSSFKIEGRLKDLNYVKNVVAFYRKAIDDVIARSCGRLKRSSSGVTELSFTPDVNRSFNRSFTTYFIDRRFPPYGQKMASIDTPKSMGQVVGKVIRSSGNKLLIDTKLNLSNGDGLSYVARDGQYAGARVNLVKGDHVVLRDAASVMPGAIVYRTYDKAMDDLLSRPSAERRVAVDAKLRYVNKRLVLSLSDDRGDAVVHSIDGAECQIAQSPQGKRQADVLGKMGDTIYVLRTAQTLPDLFVPASVLTRLRRETVELLDRAHSMRYCRDRRMQERVDASCFTDSLTRADNVANRLARQLYMDHGVKHIEPAIECCDVAQSNLSDGLEVMHTRYCLRRELGACLKHNQSRKLPAKLFLRSGNFLIAVHCDCAKCEMHLAVVKGG